MSNAAIRPRSGGRRRLQVWLGGGLSATRHPPPIEKEITPRAPPPAPSLAPGLASTKRRAGPGYPTAPAAGMHAPGCRPHPADRLSDAGKKRSEIDLRVVVSCVFCIYLKGTQIYDGFFYGSIVACLRNITIPTNQEFTLWITHKGRLSHFNPHRLF